MHDWFLQTMGSFIHRNLIHKRIIEINYVEIQKKMFVCLLYLIGEKS